MSIFFRILLSILFIPLFLIFILLTTINFQLFNYEFVTGTLHKYQAYSKVDRLVEVSLKEQERKNKLDDEEKESYAEIGKNISPAIAQEIVERNLKSVLDVIHGKSDDVLLYLPLEKLGIPAGDAFSRETIPLSTLGGGDAGGRMDLVKGLSTKTFITWLVVVGILLGILFLNYRLGSVKKLKINGIVCVVSGFLLIIFSILARFFLIQMERDLLIQDKEPSQTAIAILASSLLPEIVNTWIIMGVITLIIGLVILVFFSKSKKVIL